METMNEEYKEEVKEELGNAIAAYGQILRKASMRISTPGFEHLIECSDLELRYKIEILKDLHSRL